MKHKVLNWRLQGDVAIQYQLYRDLLDTNKLSIRNRIAKEAYKQKYFVRI